MAITSIFSDLIKLQEWYEITLCDGQVYKDSVEIFFFIKKMQCKVGTKIVPLPPDTSSFPKTKHVHVNLVAS